MLLESSALILEGIERKGKPRQSDRHLLNTDCAGHTARLEQCSLTQFCKSTGINGRLGGGCEVMPCQKRVVFQAKIIEKELLVLYEGWSSHTPVGDKEEC